MRKRFFSLFLALVLVLALMPASARATGNAVIRCGDQTAAPGDWISVPIYCEDFENLASLELDLYYDPQVLYFESGSAGWMLSDSIYHVHSPEEGRVTLTAASAQGISGSGELLYLYFRIVPDCEPGKYPLTLAVGEAYDAALSPVAVTARSGILQVTQTPPVYGEFHLGMELSDDALSPGDTVTARIRNDWGYSFAGMDLKFHYDPVMFELVSAEVSGEMDGILYSLHTKTDGLVRLTCANTWQIWCYDLLTIELRAREGVSGEAQLVAEVSDVYDENRIPYQSGSAQARVTVTPREQISVPALRLEAEPLIIGQESAATLILDAGSGLAAADFLLEYDSDLLECVAVESAAGDAYVVINPTYSKGSIRFSYVNERGAAEETPLVTIRWRPKAGASRHYSLKTTLIDPVDQAHNRAEINCPTQSGCIYRTQTTQATCTQPGGTSLYCAGCGSTIPLDTVPALGHAYGEPTFEWADNYERCTASRICSRDSSHIWQVDCTVTHVSVGESCTAPGSITYTAAADFYGDIYTDEVTIQLDSLGHDYAWTVITEPGCTTEGLRHGDCIRCDAVCEEAIAPLGHRYTSVVTESTCTESGFTTNTCTRCGFCYQDQNTDPLGHDWSGTLCRRCGEKRRNPFTDVPEGSFYHDPVLWAVENGITSGTSETTFGPGNPCNRAQVVTFLWSAAGRPQPRNTTNPFVDVPAGAWFETPVLWAVENGITSGTDATHFSPGVSCNRATVVTFLWSAAGKPAATGENPFTDVPAGAWYEAPVLWARSNGITSGISSTLFGAASICNRAQVVTFLYAAFN